MWTEALLTYLVHSSLLLGGVWLLTTCVRGMPAAWSESLWRTALLGGVLTASAQLALGYEPFGGHVALPTTAQVAAPIEATAPVEERVLRNVDAPAELLQVQPAPIGSAGSPVAASTPESHMPTLPWLALGYALVVAALGLRRRRGQSRLARRLAPRRVLEDGPLREALDRLCARAAYPCQIQLSEVAGLGSPIAFGTRVPEIVVPARAQTELSPAQQEAMLAHELAHHVRRDPRWLQAYAWAAGLLFFQPLNLLAQRRLGQTAELLADESAVSWTGRTRELAECLTAVARWAVYGAVPATASAMAQPGSMLELRVATLLRKRAVRGRTHRGLRLWALLPLVLVALFAPAVTSQAAVGTAPAAVKTTSAQPPEQPDSPVPGTLRGLDAEIRALEAEMTTLLALLDRLPEVPPALTRGAARLDRHLAALMTQRDALVSDVRTSLEKNR